MYICNCICRGQKDLLTLYALVRGGDVIMEIEYEILKDVLGNAESMYKAKIREHQRLLKHFESEIKRIRSQQKALDDEFK